MKTVVTRHVPVEFESLTDPEAGVRGKAYVPKGLDELERPAPNLRFFYIDITRNDGWWYVIWVDDELTREAEA